MSLVISFVVNLTHQLFLSIPLSHSIKFCPFLYHTQSKSFSVWFWQIRPVQPRFRLVFLSIPQTRPHESIVAFIPIEFYHCDRSICTSYQIGTLPILRWRRRRERKAEKKVKKRGWGGGERWRWSNITEEIHTPRTTTWGVAHWGRRRRYPTRWASTSGASYKVEGLQPKEWRRHNNQKRRWRRWRRRRWRRSG